MFPIPNLLIALSCAPAVVLLGACAATHRAPTGPAYDIELTPLAAGVWLHTSFRDLEGSDRFPSNGLAIETDDGVVLVDTAWGAHETRKLVAKLEATTRKTVVAAVVTHAHDDRMQGVPVLASRDIPVYASTATNAQATATGLTSADHIFDPAVTPAVLAAAGITVFYPGEGHTRDNIVIYHGPSMVLFGGCLVRAAASRGMGNTADGNLDTWGAAALAVGKRFPDARIVVPGHGAAGDHTLFEHTAQLAAAAGT